MLRRGALILAAFVLAFVLFVAIVGHVAVGSGWMRERLRDIAASETARLLGRPVAVGPLNGHLLSGIRLDGLAVAGPRGLGPDRGLTVQTVTVRYSPLRLILHPGDALATVAVTVDGVRGRLVRGPDGTLDLPSSTGASAAPGGGPPARPFSGPLVSLTDVALDYTDHALTSLEGEPLAVSLRSTAARVDVGRLISALRDGASLPPLQLATHLQASCGPQSLRAVLDADGKTVRVRDLSLTDSQTGDAVAATTVAARVDLSRLGGSRDHPLQALRHIEVAGPVVWLSRGRGGELPIMRQVSRWLPPQRREPSRPTATVAVTGGSFRWIDMAALSEPLVASARQVEAQVHLGRLLAALDGQSKGEPGTLSARIEAAAGELRLAARLRAQLGTALRVSGLEARRGSRSILSATSIEADYRLAGLLGGEGPAALRGLDLRGLRADLALDQANWPVGLPRPATPPPPTTSPPTPAKEAATPAPPLAATVSVGDADVALTLASVRGPRGALRTRLVLDALELDMGALNDGDAAGVGHISGLASAQIGRLSGAMALSGELGRGLQAADVRVDHGATQVLRAAMLRVDYDGRRLLSQPLEALERVSLQEPVVRLVVDAEGTPEPLADLPVSRGGSTKSASAPPIRVVVDRGRVDLARLGPRGGISAGSLTDLHADVHLGHLMAAAEGRAPGDIGRLRARAAAWGAGVHLATAATVDLNGRASLRNLTVTEGGSDGVVRVGSAVADFSPRQVYAGQVLPGLRAVSLRDADARLIREVDGRFRLQRLLGGGGARPAPRATGPGPGLAGLTATVRLARVNATVTDYSVPAGTAVYQVADLNGAANLARPGVGSLRGRVRVTTPSMWAAAGFGTDLASILDVHSIRIAERTGAGDRSILTAGHAGVRYSLPRLLGGDGTAALRHIALRDFTANLLREPDGRLRIARLLQGISGKRREEATAGTAPQALRAILQLAAGSVLYEDRAVEGGPITAGAEALAGRMDLARAMALLGDRPAGSFEGLGRLRARLSALTPRLVARARLDAELDSRLSVSDLSISERQGEGVAPLVSLPAGTVRYAIAGLLRPRPLEAVSHIELSGLRGRIVREQDGRLELARLLSAFTPATRTGRAPAARPADPGRLLASLRLADVEATYIDRYLGSPGEPVRLAVRGLGGTVPAGQLGDLLAGKTPGSAGRLTGELWGRWPGVEAHALLATDFRSRLSVSDLVAADPSGVVPRLTATGLDITGDLARAFAVGTSPLAALDAVDIRGLSADVTRDKQGRLDLLAFLGPLGARDDAPGADPSGPDPLGALHARVALHDSSVRYRDLAVNSDGPVTVTLAAADGAADLSRLVRLSQATDLAQVAALSGGLEVQLPHGHLSAHVSAEDLSSGVRLADVRVGGPDGHEYATILSAELGYRLSGLLGDEPLAAVSRVALKRPRARLVRTPEGALDVADLLRGFPSSAEQDRTPVAPEQFVAQVAIDDGELHLDDRFVADGPIALQALGVGADVSMARFWAARGGEWQRGTGTLRAQVRTVSAVERIAATVDWDLDRLARLEGVSIVRSDRPPAVLELDTATVTYDPDGALAEGGDVVGSLRRVQVGTLWAQARRRADGTLQLPATVEAYLPEKADSGPPAALEAREFLGGLLAHVTAGNVSLAYEDNAGARPLSARILGAAADVHVDRLAEAYRGGSSADPGRLSGRVFVQEGDLRASLELDAALADRVRVQDVTVLQEQDGVEHPLLALRRADLVADIPALLGGRPPTEQLRRLELWDLAARLERDASGRLTALARWSGPADEAARQQPEEAAPFRLAGTVAVHGADLDYSDASPEIEGGLVAAVRGLRGEVDLAALQSMRDDGIQREVGGLSGALAGRVGEFRLAGRITSDVASSLRVDDLDARDGDGRVLAVARALRARYSLAPVIDGEAPLEQVHAVMADGLRTAVTRLRDGSLQIGDGLRLALGEAAGPDPGEREAPAFAGSVELADTAIAYTDYALGDGEPLQVTTQGLSGRVDVGALLAMARDGRMREAGALSGSASLRAGEIEGALAFAAPDLGRRLKLTGATVSAGGLEDHLAAGQAAFEYDLAPLLAGRPWQEHVRHVGLHNARGALTRQAAGQLRLVTTLQDTLGLPKPAQSADEAPGEPPAEAPRFAGRVALQDVSLRYTDLAALSDGPLVAQVHEANADVDLAALVEESQTSGARGGAVSALLSVQTPAERWSGRIGGSLDDALVLRELVASSFPDGAELLRADRVALGVDLPRLVANEAPPLSTLTRLDLVGLRGTVRRDAAGAIVSPQLLGLAGGDTEPKQTVSPLLAGPFRTAVTVEDIDISLQDDGVLGDEGPLRVRLSSVSGSLVAEGVVAAEPGASWVRPGGVLRGEIGATGAGTVLRAEFETDLVRDLWVRDLASTDASGRRLARADEIRVGYNLAALGQRRSVFDIVQDLNLDNVDILTGTDRSGALLLAGFPIASVRLGGDPTGEPVPLGAIDGRLSSDAAGVVRGRLTAGGAGLLGRARVDLTYDPEDGWLDAEGLAEDLDLRLAGLLALAPEKGQVLGGKAGALGSAYGRVRDKAVAWSAIGEVVAGRARLAHLGDDPVTFDLPFAGGSEGIHTEGAHLVWAGVTADVSGAVFSPSDPVLALHARVQAPRGEQLTALLPPSLAQRISGLALTDRTTASVDITGPAESADVEVALHSVGEALVSIGSTGTLRMEGLNVAASVVNLGDPGVSAVLTAGGVALDNGSAVETRLEGAEQMKLTVLSANTKMGRAYLSLPWTRVRGVPVTDVEARVALVGDEVQVPSLSARVLGGGVRGLASVNLAARSGPAVNFEAELADADLDGLAQADFWPADLQVAGGLRANLMGTVAGADTRVGADLRLSGPEVNGRRFDELRAVLTATDAETRLEAAQLKAGDGRLWAQGMAERGLLSGDTDLRDLRGSLRLGAAELDLATVPVGADGKDLGGSLYADLQARGPLADPDVTGRLQVFSPEYDGHEADALWAEVSRSGSVLRIPRVLAAAGHAVAALTDVEISDFSLLRADTDTPLLAPDGRVRGGAVEAFAPVADITEIADAQADTGGWFHTLGVVAGTLRRPTLSGLLRADSLRLGEFFINEARLPISLSGDTLLVSDGYLLAHGARASLVGRVRDLYGKAEYSLSASVDGVSLDELPSLHRLGADASGHATMPSVVLWGAKGGRPSGSATFRLSDLRLAHHALRPLTGWVQFGGGIMRIDATRVRMVGTGTGTSSGRRRPEPGYVSLSATYDTGSGIMDAGLRISGPGDWDELDRSSAEDLASLPDVGAILQLAAPLAQIGEAAAASSTSAPRPPRARLKRADEPDKPATSRALAQMGLRSSGRMLGEIRLMGPPDGLVCAADATVFNAKFDGKSLPREMQGRLSIDLANGHVYDIDAEATDGDQSLMAWGEAFLPRKAGAAEHPGKRVVDLQVEGAGIELGMWRQWIPGPASFAGSASFALVAKGAAEAPSVKGSLDIMNPSYAGASFDLLAVPSIEVTDRAISLKGVRLVKAERVAVREQEAPEASSGRSGGARLARSGPAAPAGGRASARPLPTADGDGTRTPPARVEREITMEGALPWQWSAPWLPPDGPVALKAQMADIDLSFLTPILDAMAREKDPRKHAAVGSLWSRLEARGAMSGALEVSGAWGQPELRGSMDLADGYVKAPNWDYPLDDIQVGVSFVREAGRNRGIIRKAGARWGEVRASTQDALAYLDHLGDPGKNEYHADLTVKSDRPMDVSGMTIGQVSGAVGFHTRRQDVVGAPEPVGTHELTFEDVTVALGDGRATLSGYGKLSDLSLKSFHRNEYDIVLEAQAARLSLGKQVRGLLDGSVRLHKPEAEADREPRVRLDGRLVLNDAQLALAIPTGGGEGVIYGAPPDVPSPELDVALDVGSDVEIRGLGVVVPIATTRAAHLTGTLQRPVLSGDISTGGGDVDLPAQVMRVTKADIDYRFGPRLGPLRSERVPLGLTGNVDIRAERSIANTQIAGEDDETIQVMIAVEGRLPDDIRVRTWSDPPLTEEQLLVMLGSQTLSALSGGGGTGNLADALSEQALQALAAGFRAAIFKPIESELAKALGLSEFTISFGFNQAMGVRLGKYLIKDLLVSYQRSIAGGAGEQYLLSISYRLRDQFRVAYTTDELGHSRVKVTYDVDF